MPAPSAARRRLEERKGNGMGIEKVQECMLLGFLLILAWIDWKKREIPLLFLGIFAGGGCLAGWLSETLQWKEMMGGLLVGGILLLGALASRGSIGTGDALAFCASGIYLGFWQNLLLLFLSAVCAAGCAGGFAAAAKVYQKGENTFSAIRPGRRCIDAGAVRVKGGVCTCGKGCSGCRDRTR